MPGIEIRRLTSNIYCLRKKKQGWKIFQAFEKHCRLPGGGYASIRDVDELPVRHEDRMETFWIVSPVAFPSPLARFNGRRGLLCADYRTDPLAQSETLKYLYLLFSDADVIPLDRYTLNTEAHPLPNFTPRW